MSGYHYDRQLDEIRRREDKLFSDCAKEDAPSTGLMAKVEARIPAKLVDTMDEAFYRAFQVLFEKGTGLLRLTFSEKRLRADRFIREYYLKEDPNAERVRSFHKSARLGGIVNTVLATVEGFVMGLFGMGLPDIPVLMSLLLRTIYTTALRYGYRFDNPRERYSTFFYCIDYSCKVIVGQGHICSALSNVCSRDTHCATDIRRLQCWSIVNAVACH